MVISCAALQVNFSNPNVIDHRVRGLEVFLIPSLQVWSFQGVTHV